MQKTPEDRNCLACAFPFWAQLTADEQEMLCRYTRPVHYRKGARVHSPLESCVGILLLRTGQLRAYLLSEDGRDVTLYRLFGGEVCILSASCVMDSVNVDLYIDAEEDTEALCISAGIFRRLMQQNVYVRCYAYQLTAERFSDTMWTMQQILFMSADRRLAIFLTDELAKTGGDEVRMTHDQMAKYMGSAREVVSRMLKYFAQEGWVRLYRGGVQVLDKPKAAAAGKRRMKRGRCVMHRPLCCYGRSALAALFFPVAEIAGVSDLGGVELAVLVLGGDGGAGLHGVGVRGLRVIHRLFLAGVLQRGRLLCRGGLGRSFRGVGFGRGGGLLCGIVRCFASASA